LAIGLDPFIVVRYNFLILNSSIFRIIPALWNALAVIAAMPIISL
jgi:hypothetical protein